MVTLMIGSRFVLSMETRDDYLAKLIIWPVDIWVHGKVTSGPNCICKPVPAGIEIYQGHYCTFQWITVRALLDKMTMLPNG